MALVIEAFGTSWTKTVRNRKHHAVTVYATGYGRGDKSVRLTLKRDGKKGEEQMQLVLAGSALRELAGLLQRVLASDTEIITDFTPEHLAGHHERAEPPVGVRDESGAAHHLK
jgi:hypothetical protein